MSSEEACQDECLATTGCLAYQYRQPGDGTKHCTLFDQLDLFTPTTDTTVNTG